MKANISNLVYSPKDELTTDHTVKFFSSLEKTKKTHSIYLPQIKSLNKDKEKVKEIDRRFKKITSCKTPIFRKPIFTVRQAALSPIPHIVKLKQYDKIDILKFLFRNKARVFSNLANASALVSLNKKKSFKVQSVFQSKLKSCSPKNIGTLATENDIPISISSIL